MRRLVSWRYLTCFVPGAALVIAAAPGMAQDKALLESSQSYINQALHETAKGDAANIGDPVASCAAYTTADGHYVKATTQFQAFAASFPNGPQDKFKVSLAQLGTQRTMVQGKAKGICSTTASAPAAPMIPITEAEGEKTYYLGDIRKAITKAIELEEQGDLQLSIEKYSEGIAAYAKSMVVYIDEKMQAGLSSIRHHTRVNPTAEVTAKGRVASSFVIDRFAGLKTKLEAACARQDKYWASLSMTAPKDPACAEYQSQLGKYDGATSAAVLARIRAANEKYLELRTQAKALPVNPGDPRPALRLYLQAFTELRTMKPRIEALMVKLFAVGADQNNHWVSATIYQQDNDRKTSSLRSEVQKLCKGWDEWAGKQSGKVTRPPECKQAGF